MLLPTAANRCVPVLPLPAGEDDWVAAMATVACELHSAFSYFHWTGFYRATGTLAPAGDAGNSSMLVIGPYQGGLGCLRIPYR
jgi:GAF domain-containing protein